VLLFGGPTLSVLKDRCSAGKGEGSRKEHREREALCALVFIVAAEKPRPLRGVGGCGAGRY
jgi:hypothetical protein